MDACDPHWKEEERESECYKRNFVEPGPRVCRGHSTAKQPQSQGGPNPSERCASPRGGDSHLGRSIDGRGTTASIALVFVTLDGLLTAQEFTKQRPNGAAFAIG
jgi:hypothetical protein